MAVKFRTRDSSGGMLSPNLDIHYQGNRTTKFFPELKFKKRPSSKADKDHKDLVLKIIQNEKIKIEKELLEGTYDISNLKKADSDFVSFFQNYIDQHNYRDKRVYEAVLKKIKTFFAKDKILFSEINCNSMQRLVYYFENNLNGTTPINYVKKLKKIIKVARKEKLIINDVFEDVKISKRKSAVKDILTPNELRELWKSNCPNNSVKRAFFLACFTGLRYCDIKALKWQHIKGDRIELIQQKTKERVSIPLSDDAQKILKKRRAANDLCFNLPSHTSCNVNLKKWVENAEINKHITFHAGRHTLGATLTNVTGDILAASKILGHTSLRYTQLYTRYNIEYGKKAIDQLPKIFTNEKPI